MHVPARALLLAGALALAPACGSPPERPDILLVTLDTTRADHLAAYGHPDVRTPWLDRLARRGLQFRDAIADVPVTLPSHTTLMTAVPALAHGVRYNADFRVTDDARTLAEELRDARYDTGAVVSTLVLDAEFGLDQGFAHYDDDLTPGYVKHDGSRYPGPTHWLPRADRRADETVRRALDWMDGAARPFFLWVHVYDPHFPFDPPPPWGRAHADPYAAEIQFTDHEIGRLLRRLEDRAPGDPPAVIAVTADHGEGLDQHREDGHGIFLYDDTVRVPLILRAGSAAAPGLAAAPVRTTDVAPTLLELAGLARPFGLGASLLPVARGGGAPPPAYLESIKTRLFYSGTGLKALRTADAKFIWAPRPEVYDLRDDPGETRNLAEEDPARAARLRDALEERVRDLLAADFASAEPTELDGETAEQLRSLGYLTGSRGGGTASFAEEMALVGNDPKDLVDVSMAAREIQNGFIDRAEAKLARFFATARPPEADPGMARLWAAAHLNFAKIVFDRGDYARAAEHYASASSIDPDYAPARWRWIYCLNLAGRPGDAVAAADRLLSRYPLAWRIRVHRALALALLGRPGEARSELAAVADGENCPDDVARQAAYWAARVGPSDESLAVYLRRAEDDPDQ